jgi:hypothetical protein
MKRLIILLILFTGFFMSCEKSSSALCGGTEPHKTLPWLKMEIERINASQICHNISRSTYRDQTIYIIANCDPKANSVPQLFECDGKPFAAGNYQEIKFTGPIELIWTNN